MTNKFTSFRKLSKMDVVKRILMPIIDVGLHVALFLNKVKKSDKENYFSICAIFKDEAEYLKEWLDYHLILGVEKIYLYNNFSSDNYLEVVKPYVQIGCVDLVDWPVQAGQMSAYEDCYKKIKDKTQWICFLDIDEFICPYNDMLVSDWLKKHEGKPSVLVYWKMFGTSGKVNRNTDELLIESLPVCWPDLYDVGKIFLNTDYEPVNIYHHVLKSKIKLFGLNLKVPSLNQFGKFVYFNINRASFFRNKADIQINHYWSKTFSEYMKKKAIKGNVYDGAEIYNIKYFLSHENMNTSVDYKIFKFIIQLKIKMGHVKQIQ